MISNFSRQLLAWFDRHGRKDLPWQQATTPYRVWVSEIMLQQTQVSTVLPYYERFMKRFPTVDSLAKADADEVMHYWTGLGYYARARNLQKAARTIVEQYNGRFPDTVDELVRLPGIGRSTAGAIVAIAFDQRAPILDGNVKRVLARYFAIDGWPGDSQTAKQLWEKAESLTPRNRVAAYTQAIMDLGATLCTRSSPRCHLCPFARDCTAHQRDETGRFPGKKPKRTLPVKSTCMLIIENRAGELLLEKRPNQGVWGGLWSFPECLPEEIEDTINGHPLAGGLEKATRQPTAFRHTFTHFHLEITPVHLKLDAPAPTVAESGGQIWYSPAAPVPIGLTRPVTRIIEELR